MSTGLIVLISVASPLLYFMFMGVTMRVLTPHLEDDDAAIPLSLLWPLVLPGYFGWWLMGAVQRKLSAPRVPRAIARKE